MVRRGPVEGATPALAEPQSGGQPEHEQPDHGQRLTPYDGEHHLISSAVFPVVGGRRTRAGRKLCLVMNPGVPFDCLGTSPENPT